MNDAAIWPILNRSRPDDEPVFIARNSLSLALAAMLLGLGFSVWMCYRGQPFLSLATMGAVSVASIVLFSVGVQRSRQIWIENQKKKEVEWHKGLSSLQVQLSDTRNSEEMLWRERAQAKESAGRFEVANAKLTEE